MEFSEVKRQPEFVLNLDLNEAINLWRIVNKSYQDGNENAKQFIDALHDFAANSNRYTDI